MTELSVTTFEQERWDQLSQRTLGVPDQYHLIWQANPTLPHQTRYAPTLPGGLQLRLPEQITPPATISEAPPWR